MRVLTFGWHQVVFEHYRVVDDSSIARQLPRGVELDRFDGRPYVSVVSTRVDDSRIGGRLPMLGARSYVQINVRTYVPTSEGPALLFLYNAVSARAATVARLLYGMPNRHEAARFEQHDGTIVYDAAAHRVAGRIGDLVDHGPQDLSWFLVERYRLVGTYGPVTVTAPASHRRWPLCRFEVSERSHGLVTRLGLATALEVVEEVHGSPGVEAAIGPPRPLGALHATRWETPMPRHA